MIPVIAATSGVSVPNAVVRALLNAPDNRFMAPSNRPNVGSVLLIVLNIPRNFLDIFDEKLSTLLPEPPSRWSVPWANESTAPFVLANTFVAALCSLQVVELTLEKVPCTLAPVVLVFPVYAPSAARNPVEPIVWLVPFIVASNFLSLPRSFVNVEHRFAITFYMFPNELPRQLVRLIIRPTDVMTLLADWAPLI